MTLDNMTGITKVSYTGGDLFCKSQLITCNRVKECNGVCPFEDALKHADKEMDEQTVINHDRDWIIGCIEHDGFIHTDRFDKANQIIHDALSADAGWIPCSERLPSNNGCVLVTDDDGIEFGKCEDGEWSIWVCEHWDEWDAKGVIAWMPLPTPYKGGDSE